MASFVGHIYRFGDFALDTDQRVLLRAGKALPLTPKVFDTLLILVENGGRIVGKEELMGRLWPDTFVEEANLSVNIQQLRRALGDRARQPRYVETVARRGYRLIADVEKVSNDPAPADILSARKLNTYDPRPGASDDGGGSEGGHRVGGETGPRASDDLSRAEGAAVDVTPARLSARYKTAFVVAAALALAVGGWVLWNRYGAGTQPPDERVMLAVLPFQNFTGDPEQDYFSDGLTEEMIAQLGSLDPQRLGVIARTSVMHYKGSRLPLYQIGRELGVQYLLEGSVRRDGENVRITAQLIRVRDQTHIWARQYDQRLHDILVLQRQIGQETANQIQLVLGGSRPSNPGRQPRHAYQSYEAYDLWLKGQYFWNKRTAEGLQKAVDYFERAREVDPTYAHAYVGLASCYALMGGYTMRPQTEFMPKARAAALRALELDEGLAEAHTVMALIVQNYELDWQTAEKEFRRAIELNPNYATAHHWYAEHLMWRGRFDEALTESEQARRLDPLSMIIAADHGAILYYARRYDSAIQQFLAVRELDPHNQRSGLIIHAYDEKGLFAEALADIEAHQPPLGMNPPWYWSELAYAYGRSGQQAQARRALENLLELNRRQEVGAEAIIWAYIGVGDNEQAMAWLEKAYAQRSPALTYLKVDPRYDPLRGDPRFQDLLSRVGLAH